MTYWKIKKIWNFNRKILDIKVLYEVNEYLYKKKKIFFEDEMKVKIKLKIERKGKKVFKSLLNKPLNRKELSKFNKKFDEIENI